MLNPGKLFNVKMRAAQGGSHEAGGRHVSGAERIVPQESLQPAIDNLVKRALNHSKGQADFINITLEEIKPDKIFHIPSLPIITIEVSNYLEGRKAAADCLAEAGLSLEQAQMVLNMLENVSGMRGAMLVDLKSLTRLESNYNRGVRVTGIDWASEVQSLLDKVLDNEGINNLHAREALALASKVAQAPGIVAEVCWSDDPNYVAGYVASRKLGYIRLTHMKPFGDHKGGRAFCFDSSQATPDECIRWLEDTVTIINEVTRSIGKLSPLRNH
jgi:6-carboxyhexanoate--CoA ligase